VALASTAAGVYRSEDQAKTWELVTGKALSVSAVYATPGTGKLALALTSEGLFLSADRGRSWTAAQKPPSPDLYDIAISQDDLMLAATSRGLYRSTDKAQTWQLVNGAPGTGTVRAVSFHPVWPVAFAIHQNTVYESADGAATWTALPSRGLERCLVQALVIEPEAPDRLYALAKGRGVFVISLARPGGLQPETAGQAK
jgi:photosystem II stability/assembly factor-like uncharacterized protein